MQIIFKNDKSSYKLIDISISQTRLQQYMNTLPYFTIADNLKKREEETLELIFEHLAIVLDSSLIDQNLIRQSEMILQTQMSKYTQKMLSNVQKYLVRYKKQLLHLFLLLSGEKDEQADQQVSLPNTIEELLASSKAESFKNEQDRVYLYLICSAFMPMFFKLMSREQLEPNDLCLSNLDSICLTMRFDQMSVLYIDEHQFQKLILEHPLRILNHLPTLQGYQLYEKVNFTQLLDQVQCLVSSNLVDRKMSSLIETFNFSKVVHLAELFNNLPKTNNALLNAIQRLNILKIFSENSNPEEKIQQSSFFCLTLPIKKNFFSKMRQFFESLPPEFAPLAKYDILSFGSGEQSNTLLLRFATSEYWEHCPQSQFLEIYYLCNQTCVQWISLPSELYKQSGRIRVWSQEEIEKLYQSQYQSCSGVQKCGDFVIIGQGNEHFWRVKKGYGTATFLKWSILLKSKNQIKNYIKIAERKEKQLVQSGWNLDIPHKRLILNYLSHQYMNIDFEIIKQMIHFVKKGIKKEQELLRLMCKSFQRQVILNNSQLPCKYRICGQCGKQIINIFSHFQANAICLSCLHEQIRKRDKSYIFYVNYMCKPSDLDLFFKNIQNTVMRQVSVTFEQTIRPNQMYQETFCEGKYLGWFQSCHCLGQLTKSDIIIKQHISNYFPSLQLHVFAKRSYFCTLESTIKCYALKKCTSNQEEAQMRALLTFFAQHCLNSQQKFKIRQDIYKFYMQDNYVLEVLHALKEKISEN